MNLNWTELLKSTMVMFAVIDIVGSIPFLLDIKRKAGDIHAERASLVALGIMLAFLFLGEGVINFLGIDVNSFAVAGSIVMFFMALEMILGITLFKKAKPRGHENSDHCSCGFSSHCWGGKHDLHHLAASGVCCGQHCVGHPHQHGAGLLRLKDDRAD